MVYAMRSCGQGFSGIERFTTLMDMPKPMTQNNYDKVVKSFAVVAETVANDTMTDAIEELKLEYSVPDNTTFDVSISQDGSWQRRGYSSMNGCMTAIAMDNGKIVDIEPMSRYCKGCIRMEIIKTSNPNQYEDWKEKHKCNYNYKGSAGGWKLKVLGEFSVVQAVEGN